MQGRFWCRSDGVHTVVREEMRRYANLERPADCVCG